MQIRRTGGYRQHSTFQITFIACKLVKPFMRNKHSFNKTLRSLTVLSTSIKVFYQLQQLHDQKLRTTEIFHLESNINIFMFIPVTFNGNVRSEQYPIVIYYILYILYFIIEVQYGQMKMKAINNMFMWLMCNCCTNKTHSKCVLKCTSAGRFLMHLNIKDFV